MFIWKTIQQLKGRWDLAQAAFSQGGEVLTSSGNSVQQWTEHSEELLTLVDMPSHQEAALEPSVELDSIIGA